MYNIFSLCDTYFNLLHDFAAKCRVGFSIWREWLQNDTVSEMSNTTSENFLVTWSRDVTASIVCLCVCFALFCFSYFWFAILLETPAVTWRAYHNWPFNIFTSAGYSRVSFLSSFVWSFVSNPAGEKLRLSFHLFCARLCIFLHDFRPHSWLTDKKSWCN